MGGKKDSISYHSDKALRSVFVANIAKEVTEENLIEVFSVAGKVLSFKLIYDRETGNPKGYGFCEYINSETTLDAVQMLNGHEIGNRTLRVQINQNSTQPQNQRNGDYDFSCRACGEMGHKASECQDYNNGYHHSGHNKLESSSSAENEKGCQWQKHGPEPLYAKSYSERDKCFICQKSGHWASDCPKRVEYDENGNDSISNDDYQRNSWRERKQSTPLKNGSGKKQNISSFINENKDENINNV